MTYERPVAGELNAEEELRKMKERMEHMNDMFQKKLDELIAQLQDAKRGFQEMEKGEGETAEHI